MSTPPARADASRRLGIVADTHGMLRPELGRLFSGCESILHAGDVGAPDVLVGLERIAPVKAVRGNVDRGEWAWRLPARRSETVAGARILLIHDRDELDLDPEAEGFRVVVSGHTHRPRVEERGSVLYVNPGSAGPRRFSSGVSAAVLEIFEGRVVARIVDIGEAGP